MTVPPARQCTLPECERAAVDPSTSGSLCEKCKPGESPEATLEATVSKDAIPNGEAEEPASGTAPFADVDFTDPNSGVWPDDRLEVEQWMGRKPDEKLPYAPWTDRDAPAPCNRDEHDGDVTCAECDHSAR